LQGARDARHALDKEDRKLQSIGREAWGLNIAFQFRALRRTTAVGGRGPNLSGGNIAGKIGDERQALAVSGPGYIAQWEVCFHGDYLGRPAARGNYGKFSIGEVGDLRSVGRERNLTDSFGVRHGVKHGSGARRRGILRQKRNTAKYGSDGTKQPKNSGTWVRAYILDLGSLRLCIHGGEEYSWFSACVTNREVAG
jgi:hypothetical protein